MWILCFSVMGRLAIINTVQNKDEKETRKIEGGVNERLGLKMDRRNGRRYVVVLVGYIPLH